MKRKIKAPSKTLLKKVGTADLISDLKESLKELYARADAGESWANDEIESILIRIKKLEMMEQKQ